MRRTRRRLGTRAVVVMAAALLTIPLLGVPAAQAAAPTITSINPTTGPIGTVVTITGTGFNDAPTPVSAVTFNTTAATSFTVVSDTSITATVPTGATTGAVAVTDSEGTAMGPTFTVTASPVPTITSFTPTTGPAGTVVTITGTGFTGASAVTFGGVAATTFTVASDTSITATVPAAAVTGPIAVTTPGGTATSATPFTVEGGDVDHERSVSFALAGHLRATGQVNSDADECEAGVRVRIQRRVAGDWRNVGSDVTNGAGRFRDRVNDQVGRYRAFVRQTPADDGTCLEAVSQRQRHTHKN